MSCVLLLNACGERPNIDQAAADIVGVFDPKPSVVLQEQSGQEFVEVVDGLILDSSIVIADRGTGYLHVYDRQGHYLKALGGKGKGPGEFQSIEWIDQGKNSIWLYDRELKRLSEFSLRGRFLRNVSVTAVDGFSYSAPIAMTDGGQLLVAGFISPNRSRTDIVFRDSIVALFFDIESGAYSALASFKSNEVFSRPFGKIGTQSAVMPFGHQAAALAVASSVAIVESEFPHVRFVNTTRSDTVFLPIDSGGRSKITAQDIAAVRKRFTQGEARELPASEFFDAMPVPSRMGYFGSTDQRLLFLATSGGDGRLWVRLAETPRSQQAVWIVIDSAKELSRSSARSTEHSGARF